MLRTIDKVAAYEVLPEGVTMVQQLEENMDLSQIAYKLASQLLGQDSEAGPERIGLDERDLKDLNSKSRQNRRKRFPRRNGGGGGGGGGGGRGGSGGGGNRGGSRGGNGGGNSGGGGRGGRR